MKYKTTVDGYSLYTPGTKVVLNKDRAVEYIPKENFKYYSKVLTVSYDPVEFGGGYKVYRYEGSNNFLTASSKYFDPANPIWLT